MILWLLVTFAALMGMYRLWWQRERNLYWGKGVDAQRAEVFTRAGIPASILKAFKEIDASWPKNARYQASGDSNTLSYIKYLLVPRTPSDKSEYQIEATGSTLVIMENNLNILRHIRTMKDQKHTVLSHHYFL